MKLVTAAEMQNLDKRAINELGIPGIVLMENAGRLTVDSLVSHFGDPLGKIITIFVGPGNNGGDGLVIARHLHQKGCLVQICFLVPADKLQGDAAINLKIVNSLDITCKEILTEEAVAGINLDNNQVVVDALFGTGLRREISGHFAAVIELINQGNRPVVSVDIPSGLDSDSGQILGCSVRADLTVTYGSAKLGQFCYPGAALCGELEVADIGIPPHLLTEAEIKAEALNADVADFLPERPAAGHKGTFGHVLAVAGSSGKTGAALLSVKAALRSGAGLVSLCVPKSLNCIFETSLPEAMTIPLPETEKNILTVEHGKAIQEAAQNKRAIIVGPGLGIHPKTIALVRELYRRLKLPMVVDADALNSLAMIQKMENASGERILTPHPGEMARLTGRPIGEIQADRINTARNFAVSQQVYIILKGAGTVIAAPDGRIAVNSTGNPGLATGGSGDVLAGLVAGLLAQGLSLWQASCLGVYIHGVAADMLAARLGASSGFLAGELADELPAAMARISIKEK